MDCGLCVSKCKMDIRHVGDHECISCGECIAVCPTKAITWKGSRFFLPPDEIGTTDAECEQIEKRNEAIKRRNRRIGFAVTAVMLAFLAGVLVYFNVIDKAPTPQAPSTEEQTPPATGGEDQLKLGFEIGDLCYGADIPVVDSEGEIFNVGNTRGKLTIVNFWNTGCQPCVEEMPHFDEFAKAHPDTVAVIAICSNFDAEDVSDFIAERFDGFSIKFGLDFPDEAYFNQLGGRGTWPMTLVLDGDGVVVYRAYEKISYEKLEALYQTHMVSE